MLVVLAVVAVLADDARAPLFVGLGFAAAVTAVPVVLHAAGRGQEDEDE